MQEAVRDLEAVLQQRDGLARSLAEAQRANGRAAQRARDAQTAAEALRRGTFGSSADRAEAKHAIAALQAQVCLRV